MRTQVRKIGNSLGSIIPRAFIRQLNLSAGSEIEIRAEDGRIIIEAAKPSASFFPFSESELLKGLNEHTAHADEIATPQGKELGE